MSGSGRFEYTVGFKTDDSGLKQALQSLQNIQKMTTNMPGFSEMSGELAEASKAAFDLEQALTKAFNPKMGTVNTTVLRNELSKLNLGELRESLVSIGPAGETAFNQLAASAMKANLQINQSNTLLTRFGKTLFRNLEWLLSGNIISTIAGVFTKAYGYTKNLDSSLNDIRIVTGKSADEMARFGREAQKTAMELGKGTTDITNASLIYFQQGLDEEEVNKRTEVTAKMANVTGQAAETVANQMTAVWNGFQAGNDELERYADIMTKVAASTASSSAELAGAISKTASIAKTTGVDMEQLTSMISTVISVTRDSPEAVGTAFKTIFARINDLVEDGTDEFGVSLGRVSSHLAAMGIEILNEDGTLKDLGDTITETGEKWKFYSQEQKVAIAEQMGGKRQWNQILSLFDHWDDYKDTLVEATEATGSLDEQQEIYMDRVETHLQQVKTAWEGVYNQVFNEKDIIKVADAIKNILEGVETFLDTVGGFKPVLDMVITLMLQAFGPKMAQEVDRTFSNIKNVFANMGAEAAQRDITLMFGNLGDKGLLSELVEHQKTMNRYKEQMNEKDQEQYSNYLKQKIALSEQTKELSKQVEEAKEFALARKEIGDAYTRAGGFDVGGFAPSDIEERLKIIQELRQGKISNLSGSEFAIGTDVNAFEQMKVQRSEDITNLITQLQQYKQEAESVTDVNEKEISGINKLINSLQGVKDTFDTATLNNEEFEKSLNKSTTAAEKAATQLLNLKNATPSAARDDVLSQIGVSGQGTSTFTQFREENNKMLADSQASVDTYKNLIKGLGDASILSADQVGALNAKLAQQTPDLEALKRALSEQLGVSEQGLENIMKVISQHSEGQLKVAEDTRRVLDNAQANMEKSLSFRDKLTDMTRMASLASQMAMSFNQIQNIGRIIQDEDIKGSEKIGRVLSSTAMMLPMIMSLFSKLMSSSLVSEFGEAVKQHKDIRTDTVAKAKEAQTKAEYAVQEAYEKNLDALRKKYEAERHYQKKKNLYDEYVQEEQQATKDYISRRDRLNNAIISSKTSATEREAKKQVLRNLQEERREHILNAHAIEEERLAEMESAKASYESAAANQTQTASSLKEAGANKASAVSAVEDATAQRLDAKWTAANALAKMGLYAAIAAAVAIAVILYKKYKEAQEELEETTKRNSQIIQDHIKANQELIKSNQKVLASFQDYDKVWDSFKKGKATIDEVRASIDELAQSLDIEEDEEYLRLKRLAEYSGQYEALNEYLENKKRQDIIEQQVTVMEETSDLTGGLREQKWLSDRAKIQKNLNPDLLWGEDFKRDFIENTGLELEFSRMSFEELQTAIEYLQKVAITGPKDAQILANEVLNELTIYARKSEEKAAVADLEIWKLFSGERTESIKAYQDTDISGVKKEFSFSGFKFDETTTEAEIQEQLSNFAKFYKAYMAEQGKAITEEEAYQIGWDWFNQTQLGAGDALTSIEWKNHIKDSLNETIEEIKKIPGKEHLELFTEEEIAAAEDKLKEAGIDLTKIDWTAVKGDTHLVEALSNDLTSSEAIEGLQKYRTNIQYLTQDYVALASSFDDFNEKVKKGSFDVGVYNSKAFQEFFNEEVQEEIKEVYGETSDVAEAINTLNDTALIGTSKWKEAWEKYGEAIKNAKVKQAVQEVGKEVDNLLKDGLTLNAENFKNSLEQALEADYHVDVEIRTNIESAAQQIISEMDEMSKAASKIGENFIVSRDDLDTLAETFPDILDGMTVLADGSIQLNEDMAKSAIKRVQDEKEARLNEKIEQYKDYIELLEHKKKINSKMIEAAQKLADGEFKSAEEASDQIKIITNGLSDLKIVDAKWTESETESIREDSIEAWDTYYDQLDEEDKKFWNTILERRKVASTATDKSEIEGIDYDFSSISWTDLQKKLKDYKNQGWEAIKNGVVYGAYQPERDASWEQLKKEAQKRGEEYLKILKDREAEYDAEIKSAQSAINRLTAQKIALASEFNSIGQAKDKSTKSTDNQKDSEAELLDLLDDEIDAYHDINILIAKHRQELEQLQKAQEKLTGQSLIDNLEQQKKKYEQLNEDLEENLRLKNEEAALYRAQLENQGVTFDAEGYISNYNKILREKEAEVNAVLQDYNNMSAEDQDVNKDWIEQKKQEYEDFKDLIEKYEKIANPAEDIDKILEEIKDNQLKVFELDLEIINTKYQIKLDKGELKRSEIQLQKEIQKIQDSDVLGNVTVDIKTLLTFDETQEGAQLKENFEKIKEQYESYINNNLDLPKQIEEAYKTALENWTKYVSERTQQIEDIVTKSFDRLSKKLDRQKTQFETIDKIFEHDINLVKLRYGENAYQQLEALYKARERVSKAQLENANLQVEVIQNALREAQENELGQDVINDLEDKLAESYETQRQMLEDHLNFLKEQSNQAIDEIFDHLNEQMAGVSLEKMKSEWDWVNRDSDDYYDTIDAAYELEKLRSQMKKAINETDDISTQQALNQLMNDELTNLQQKDKLSKYDLERANALFDIEQKRAAFREAQNNKSKMRLRRDASGNYSYQFVSDEDKVTSAMQDLADAQNQLYNIDKEAYKNNLDKMYEYYVEYQEKLKEANNDEERAQITKDYLDKIAKLQEEHYNIIDNLQEIAAEQTGKKFDEMAQYEKDVLMGEIVPAWSTAWAAMVRDPNFQQLLSVTGAEASNIASKFEIESDKAIQETTGTTLEDITNGIDPAVSAIESMTASTAELTAELYDLVTVLSLLPSALAGDVESMNALSNISTDRNITVKTNTIATQKDVIETVVKTQTQDGVTATTVKDKTELDLINNVGFIEQTLKSISDKLDKFYNDQAYMLKLESARSSLMGAYNAATTQLVTDGRVVNINADFPAVNSAQEIKNAFNMLMNQATQDAFSTLK